MGEGIKRHVNISDDVTPPDKRERRHFSIPDNDFRRRKGDAVSPASTGTSASKADEPALRYDAGKPAYELIPAEFMEALARHYQVGANKYAPRNWEKGMSWSRCFGALMRHAWKFWRGEQYDPETGSHHMISAVWNCVTLFSYDIWTRREIKDLDDRPDYSSCSLYVKGVYDE